MPSLWDRLSGLASPLFTGLKNSPQTYPLRDTAAASLSLCVVVSLFPCAGMIRAEKKPEITVAGIGAIHGAIIAHVITVLLRGTLRHCTEKWRKRLCSTAAHDFEIYGLHCVMIAASCGGREGRNLPFLKRRALVDEAPVHVNGPNQVACELRRLAIRGLRRPLCSSPTERGLHARSDS